ncbi:hypothetical protein [Salegentibacter sp. F14]
MKEKKNLDRLYQEKFKDYEVAPPPRVWKNIADRLEEDKKKSHLILPFWYKIAGVAAVFALLLTGGYFFYQNNFFVNSPGLVFEWNEIKRPRIDTSFENKTLTETKNLLQEITSNKQINNSSQLVSSGNNGFISSQPASLKEKASGESSSETSRNAKLNSNIAIVDGEDFSQERENETLETQEGAASNMGSDSNDLIADKTEKKSQKEGDSISKNTIAYLEDNNKEEEKDEKKSEKGSLSLSTFAAPIVYDKFGKGNSIDPQFAGNPSNPNLTMAYGINVSYQVSEKLKIRSGIGKVAMSYDIQDIIFSAAIIPHDIASIDYSPEGSNFQIQGNSQRDSYSSIENTFAPENASISRLGKINQRFGYIEIPLELEYKLIDRKIGLNIIGGGSSLILEENTLLLSANNQSAHIGEANNINDLSFSTNIGFGINYKLTQRLKLNLEPIFKYQINTFENTENLQPYYFGVYSGLSFKF